MANENEELDEVIEDFVEPEQTGPEPTKEEIQADEIKSAERNKEAKRLEDEKKKAPKETSRPNEKIDVLKAARPETVAADKMTINAAGIARPKVELRNGREEFLTRKLLAEIGDYNEKGVPKHDLCEEMQKVERLTKLLTAWENGIAV